MTAPVLPAPAPAPTSAPVGWPTSPAASTMHAAAQHLAAPAEHHGSQHDNRPMAVAPTAPRLSAVTSPAPLPGEPAPAPAASGPAPVSATGTAVRRGAELPAEEVRSLVTAAAPPSDEPSADEAPARPTRRTTRAPRTRAKAETGAGDGEGGAPVAANRRPGDESVDVAG